MASVQTENEVYRGVVGIQSIREIMGPGFASSHVRRKIDPRNPYYDPEFPKPRRYPRSNILCWFVDDLVAYREKFLGR